MREGVLLRGPAGWGEWAPFPEYDDATRRAGWPPGSRRRRRGGRRRCAARSRSTRSSRRCRPTTPRRRTAADEQSGCTTYKIKVAEPGQARRTTSRGWRRSRRRCRPAYGCGWTRTAAGAAPRRGQRCRAWVTGVEQPCASLADCAQVRDLAPVAVDEGLGSRATRRPPATSPTSARRRRRRRRKPPRSAARPAGARPRRSAGLPWSSAARSAPRSGSRPGSPFPPRCRPSRTHGLGTGRLLARDVTVDRSSPATGCSRSYASRPTRCPLPPRRPTGSPGWAARLVRCAAAPALRSRLRVARSAGEPQAVGRGGVAAGGRMAGSEPLHRAGRGPRRRLVRCGVTDVVLARQPQRPARARGRGRRRRRSAPAARTDRPSAAPALALGLAQVSRPGGGGRHHAAARPRRTSCPR